MCSNMPSDQRNFYLPSLAPCAYLGMYDFPALRPALNAWWTGLAGHFKEQGFDNPPGALDRSGVDPYEIWLAPNLFLAQTCGYPLTHRLAGKVRLVGTPCYNAPGCDGAFYRSLFIVRTETEANSLSDVLPARVAVNGEDSYSGWLALRKAVVALDRKGESFSEIVNSGSHANSIDCVREGKADIAAIDCVTLALIGDVEPERLAGTRVLEQSLPAPGLPFITNIYMSESDVVRMTTAIRNAFIAPELEGVRRALRLAEFRNVSLQDYERFMT